MNSALFPVVTESDSRLPLYLTSVGHWTHQEPVHRPDGFPDYQWLHVVSGEGLLEVGGKQATVRAGQNFCLFPHMPHQYEAVKSPWGLYWVAFNGKLAAELLREAGISASGVHASSRPALVADHLRGMYETAQSAGRPFLGEEYSKRLYALLLDLRNTLHRSGHTEQHYARLAPVLRLIDEQLHRPLSISEMAAAIGASPQHLCALFRKTFALRPTEYVNRERVKRSKELMFREGNLPIREIARRVGFENPSYFGAVFKRLEGQSPERFKRMHGLKY